MTMAGVMVKAGALAVAAFGAALPLRAERLSLPAPSSAPQHIARATDGFLAALADRHDGAMFDARIVAAIAALPVLGERRQDVEAARAVRNQARAGLFPRLGLDAVAAQTLARDFRLRTTQVESLVPRSRNDISASADQLLFDFGATSARIRSGAAATDSARADLDAARSDAVMVLIGVWYEQLAATTAVSLSLANVARLAELAAAAALRFDSGIDSGGDVARARSYLAAAQSRGVGFERRLAAARARTFEVFGAVPDAIFRPALPGAVTGPAALRPEVMAARADEQQTAAALAAARAERLPRIDARIGATAFDVIDAPRPDYDIRAQFTLRQRFSIGGGEAARVAELAARRNQARFAVDRIEALTGRELAIARSDADGLAAALPPLENAYLDSRRARDLFVEQFRVSRGTLFDVLRAERDLLDAALSLAQTSYEHDVARFTLLARQGALLDRFGLADTATTAERADR